MMTVNYSCYVVFYEQRVVYQYLYRSGIQSKPPTFIVFRAVDVVEAPNELSWLDHMPNASTKV